MKDIYQTNNDHGFFNSSNDTFINDAVVTSSASSSSSSSALDQTTKDMSFMFDFLQPMANVEDIENMLLNPNVTTIATATSTASAVDYFPQISINTAEKILASDPKIVTEATATLKPSQSAADLESLLELCNTFEQPPPPPPSTPQPRTSRRLIEKKMALDVKSEKEEPVTLAATRGRRSVKRKGSSDLDQDFVYETQVVSRKQPRIAAKQTPSPLPTPVAAAAPLTRVTLTDIPPAQQQLLTEYENMNERNFNEYFMQLPLQGIVSDFELDDSCFSNKEELFRHHDDEDYEDDDDEDENPLVKKESNKVAATRYRLKKLSEKDQLFQTRHMLELENGTTKKQIEQTQTEINYLKYLLVQILLSKGLRGIGSGLANSNNLTASTI